jgi:hypothetical protein
VSLTHANDLRSGPIVPTDPPTGSRSQVAFTYNQEACVPKKDTCIILQQARNHVCVFFFNGHLYKDNFARPRPGLVAVYW